MTAATLDDQFTFPQYQAREEQLFARVRALESTIDAADRTPVNRYHPGSLSHPSSAGRDWNRSFETSPAAIRGGALLLHGLTDSPYSMRAVAEVLRDNGIYSLALRMPGHGTIPSGLVSATWADWLAAVRMGVRHVRSRIPDGAPLVLVGYSNGGALALKYTLDAIEGHGGPRALEAHSAVADDRRDARRRPGLVDQPPRRGAVLREGELAGRLPGIQPVQVQLVRRQRRVSDGVPDASHPKRSRPGRGKRPARRDPADPDLSIGRRCHREHPGGGAIRSTISCRRMAASWCCSTSITSRASRSSCSRRIDRWSRACWSARRAAIGGCVVTNISADTRTSRRARPSPVR